MDQIKQFCQQRITELIREEDRSLVTERLRQEIEVIQSSNQVGAFEQARVAVQHLKDHGVSSRLIGAGCSSLVSYLMGFSQIDPSEHGLPYERFLSANANGVIQFKFLAFSQVKRSEEDFTAILDEASCDLVTFRSETPLSTIPSSVAQEICRPDLNFSLLAIPLNDDATFQLLRSGDIEGISQLDGREIQRLLPDLNPCCLTDIAAIGALQISEMQEIGILKQYIHRGITQQYQEPPDCLVSEVLKETRGMILFQEQIMLIMNRMADIPLADAYSFIKAACKRRWEQVTIIRDWFVAQLLGNGTDDRVALGLFQRLLDASTQSVCKSHYLSEALTTYRAAFVKAHFPEEFSRTLQFIQR